MNGSARSFLIGALAGALTSLPVGAAELKDSKLGLQVGELVPISSMEIVVGDIPGRNTCLAGRYRSQQAVSIYVDGMDEPGLANLLQAMDRLPGAGEKLRIYVLARREAPVRDVLRRKMVELNADRKLKHVDFAISNSPSEKFSLNQKAAVTVVFSESRRVKHHVEFGKGRLNAEAIENLKKSLEDLTAQATILPR